MIKLLKVLGDNTYVVEIDPDKNKFDAPTQIGVAHDYVRIETGTSLYADKPIVSHPSGGSSNVLYCRQAIQIPINVAGAVLLPYLNEHENLKEDHYKNYSTYGSDVVLTWDKVFIKKEDGSWESISKELYNAIKKLP